MGEPMRLEDFDESRRLFSRNLLWFEDLGSSGAVLLFFRQSLSEEFPFRWVTAQDTGQIVDMCSGSGIEVRF